MKSKIPVVVYFDDEESKFYFTNPYQLGHNIEGTYRTHEADTLEELQENGIYELINMHNSKYSDLDKSNLTDEQILQIRNEAKELINVIWVATDF